MGVSDPQGKGRFGGLNPRPKHATANCCCHLANTVEELSGQRFQVLPNYFGACYLLNLIIIVDGEDDGGA